MNKKIKVKIKFKVMLVGCICVANIFSTFKIDYIYGNIKNYNKNYIKVNMNLKDDCYIKDSINKNNQERKIAYITIDDGPSKYTDEIIDILNKYNAKATFFMIDRNMKNYPKQVRNIIDNGNTPGLHSVSHDIHELYKTNEAAKEEYDVNKETFYNITGQYSYIIRLPYGSKPYTPPETYNNLVEAGYKIWDWNIDTEDWKQSSEQIVYNIKMNTKNKDKVVILIHEKKQTVEALDEVLKYLTNEGYSIEAINKEDEPKNYWLQNFNR